MWFVVDIFIWPKEGRSVWFIFDILFRVEKNGGEWFDLCLRIKSGRSAGTSGHELSKKKS